MKPNRRFSLVKILFLAGLAAGLSTGLASAQEFHGKFRLPFEARWGTALLPPGDYTFELVRSRPYIAVRQGLRGVAFVMTSVITSDERSGPSALVAVRSGANYRIRALHLANMGLTLEYRLPKAERRVLAQAPMLTRRVPILIASK